MSAARKWVANKLLLAPIMIHAINSKLLIEKEFVMDAKLKRKYQQGDTYFFHMFLLIYNSGCDYNNLFNILSVNCSQK
jgi:hypothetical protein